MEPNNIDKSKDKKKFSKDQNAKQGAEIGQNQSSPKLMSTETTGKAATHKIAVKKVKITTEQTDKNKNIKTPCKEREVKIYSHNKTQKTSKTNRHR